MVPDTASLDTDDRSTANDGFGTALNGLIGGVVGVVLSFVPIVSTIAGGAVAGYLEGGDAGDGLTVGAIAGLVMLVPYTLLAVLFLFLLVGDASAAFGVVGVFVLLVTAAITVGLSVLGGVLGVVLSGDH